MKTLELHPGDIGKGSLILVNPSRPLKEEPQEDRLVSIGTYTCPVLLERQAARMLTEILSFLDCGKSIIPISGFRTLNEQQNIYHESLCVNGNDFTRQYVAIPGCSEHQTGLAVDLAENKEPIDFIRPRFPYDGVCQRFREMAAEYGFIERYPAGMEQITHIAHEPWHFRYTGYPHSRIITDEKMTLEEYTEYLKKFNYNRERLKLSYKGLKFEISFIPILPEETVVIQIPDRTVCQISGNNVDGVVMTLWEMAR